MSGLRRLSCPPQTSLSRSSLAGGQERTGGLLLAYVARTHKLLLVEETV